MKLPFFKSKKKEDERAHIKNRLSKIEKGTKKDELPDDVEYLVGGLAEGDG